MRASLILVLLPLCSHHALDSKAVQGCVKICENESAVLHSFSALCPLGLIFTH